VGFSFPRSYIYRICIATYTGETVVGAGPTYIVHAVPPTTTFIACEIDTHIFNWSSNSYLLKDVLIDFHAETPPSIVQTPLNYTLSYGLDPVHHEPALLLEWFFLTPTFVNKSLPSQPGEYWLPPPLP
jgi:hypothetical protein